MLRDAGEHGKAKTFRERYENYVVSRPLGVVPFFLGGGGVVGGARCNTLPLL